MAVEARASLPSASRLGGVRRSEAKSRPRNPVCRRVLRLGVLAVRTMAWVIKSVVTQRHSRTANVA